MKARIAERIDAAAARQPRGKHISTATDIDAITEDVVISMRPMPRLYKEDQLGTQVSQQSVGGQSWQLAVLSCIISSRLATPSEQTEDLHAAVVVTYRLCKTVRLLVLFNRFWT
jgi:hypothetical protein